MILWCYMVPIASLNDRHNNKIKCINQINQIVSNNTNPTPAPPIPLTPVLKAQMQNQNAQVLGIKPSKQVKSSRIKHSIVKSNHPLLSS